MFQARWQVLLFKKTAESVQVQVLRKSHEKDDLYVIKHIFVLCFTNTFFMQVLKYVLFPVVFSFILIKQVGFDAVKNSWAETRRVLGI